MLGIILCGGQSLRMGSDKGLIKPEEKTWAAITADKIKLLNIPVKISVNKNQSANYAAIFSTDNLISDNDLLSVKGPLLGLLSCHLAFPNEDLFVLACDMPLMETSMLNTLYKKHKEQIAEAYIYTNDGEAEPLCAIYTAKGLAAINEMFKKEILTKFSLKIMLEHLIVNKTALLQEEKKYFRNFNTASEISE
jgi:molybdenum cofactor guanylyltransferase